MTTDQNPPMPAPDAPHAYIAVQRTHSPYADRPEWAYDAAVIGAHETRELERFARDGWHLLPIGPDGDTGTRWIPETPASADQPGWSVLIHGSNDVLPAVNRADAFIRAHACNTGLTAIEATPRGGTLSGVYPVLWAIPQQGTPYDVLTNSQVDAAWKEWNNNG